MSTIDRRLFVAGCLAMPLAGCATDNTTRSFVGSPSSVTFQNSGNWQNYGNTTIGDEWVYVVTPGFKS